MKIALIFLMSCFISSPVWAQSVADAAHENRPKDAHPATKRVWTNDDFPSAVDIQATGNTAIPASKLGTQESTNGTLEQFGHLGKEELGAAVLKMANANVDFPNRKDWEQRLFDAKQAWLNQLDRMMAHKDSNQNVKETEIGLTRNAQSNFENVRRDGIEQARAVNDPVLSAHKEYERRLDFCKQASGDFLLTCLNAANDFKYQMQRDGIW